MNEFERILPDIPVSEQDEIEAAKLLAPILPPDEIEPELYVGDDCWELVLNKTTHRFENLADFFHWMIEHRDEVHTATLFRRLRGDLI